MKARTLFTALIFSGIVLIQAPTQAAPLAKKGKHRTWEKEVAHYLNNLLLPNKLDNSLVMMHITIDQARTIQSVAVYSDNVVLKEAFKQRLLGKSLRSLPDLAPEPQSASGKYLLKVHVKVN